MTGTGGGERRLGTTGSKHGSLRSGATQPDRTRPRQRDERGGGSVPRYAAGSRASSPSRLLRRRRRPRERPQRRVQLLDVGARPGPSAALPLTPQAAAPPARVRDAQHVRRAVKIGPTTISSPSRVQASSAI